MDLQSEAGDLFYTNGDSCNFKTLTFILADHLYQKTVSIEALNSRGLPHEKFHLAFLSPFERNIYQNTYSSYHMTILPHKATIVLRLRFARSTQSLHTDLEFEPGEEEYIIELPRIDFDVYGTVDKINLLQQKYQALYRLATLNNITIVPCDILTQPAFVGQSWKNVPIVKFMRTIVDIEACIENVYDLFVFHGKSHLLFFGTDSIF